MYKPFAGMSPDRKIAWVLLIAGIGKIYGLDAWIPLPESPEQVIHVNQQVQELSEQIKRQVQESGSSFSEMLTIIGSVAYVILKKLKEITIAYKGGKSDVT